MSTTPRWHVGRWGVLGWAETVVKLAAHVVAFAAVARAFDGDRGAPHGARLGALIVLVVMTLGLVAAIVDRVAMREVVSMAFVVVNVIAHAAMTVAVFTDPAPGWRLVAFAALMLAGDLVKVWFLRRTGFTVRGVAPRVVLALTGVYVALDALLLLLALAA